MTAGNTLRDRGPGPFLPASWLRGAHAQTIGAALLPSGPALPLEREIVELPDGDFVEAHWGLPRRPEARLMIILPGLEGASDSACVRRLLAAATGSHWQAVVLHARGCGDLPNRLPRGYHAGESGDLAAFLRWPSVASHPAVAAVGYSLGGNILAKHLGETGPHSPLAAAAGVSVPYDLADAADAMDRRAAWLYRNRLLGRMKTRLRQGIRSGRLPSRWRGALRSRTFRSFDDRFTAPCHGFADASDYYQRCSAGKFLDGIRRPTLLVHARDDPFMTPDCIPGPVGLPPEVSLQVFDRGGHLGFIHGGTPVRPESWLEARILAFLDSVVPQG
ncbi:MAG: alpha/beta fold hydrolase [Gammaproteobacteria bacterium]